MKKHITATVLLFLMVFSPGFGAQMCAKTNTYISIFRKNVDGVSAECSNSASDKIWKVVYDYSEPNANDKIITGFASCNGLDGNTSYTTVNTTGATEGVHCWCKMAPVTTYKNGDPTGVVSYWIYLKTYDTAALCADTAESGCNTNRSGCTASCMNAMKTNSSFRSTVFQTIW